MDYSSENLQLWNFIVQLGIISVILLFSHFLRRKLRIIEKALIPTAVLGGFILLLIKTTNIINIDPTILEYITFHGIAIGFIAMALQVTKNGASNRTNALIGAKSGALLVSTYLLQGLVGLIITIGLVLTVMPTLFPASGILLPMGYGQGPGQANNIGSMYETLGFAGGRSFGLSIAAAGYLCACVVGVFYANIIIRNKKVKSSPEKEIISGSVTIDAFQDENEVPISESVDRLSIQLGLVIIVYFATFLLTAGIVNLLEIFAPGLSDMVSPILWGFNFIIGTLVAMIFKVAIKGLKRTKIIKRQYQNNYLLSRISGLAFDLMIVCGIASIDFKSLKGLLLPFILLAIAGAIVTLVYLRFMCNRLYPEYKDEAFMSMFGNLTGTISSGILLLREFDPEFKTPAANNLIVGSGFAIAFGFPLLIFISIAAKSLEMAMLTGGLLFVYMIILIVFMLKFRGKVRNEKEVWVPKNSNFFHNFSLFTRKFYLISLEPLSQLLQQSYLLFSQYLRLFRNEQT